MSNNRHHHILPLRLYLGIGAALLVLTVVTVAVSFVNLGPWNLAVAMVIASVKGLLVALFFMHLFYDHKLYGVIFSTGIVMLSVFIILTMFDTMARDKIYETKAAPIQQESGMYRQIPADTTGIHNSGSVEKHDVH